MLQQGYETGGTPAFGSQVVVVELAVLHVCKLPPEVNKMVPCVNSSSVGPLQRPEINFGAFIL